MSEGIVTRRASDIRPLLLDRFRNAAAAYSLRPLTLSGQDNPVVKVRRSVDDAEQDFNPAQINDGTLEQFVNAGDVAPADYGTGAAAAYSLRHVSDGYTGDVIRVRESTNNSEQDFNPTEITDGTLLAFCGAGDGHVTTWYDQSGNSNDATQAAAASQPKIVSGGSLVTENGKAALDFDGSDDFFSTSSWGISGTIDRSFFITAKADANISSDTYVSIGDGTLAVNSNKWILTTEIGVRVQGGNEIYGSPSTAQALVSHIFSGTNVTDNTAYINGTESVATSSVAPNISTDDTVNQIGSKGTALTAEATFDGKYQELLIYATDQSSNRELIETNVNHYYSIYSQTNDGFVTTWYDQSGNRNDATQATAASQPKIVSAGSLVTENGKASLDFDGVDDYLDTVTNFTSDVNISAFVTALSRNVASDAYLYDNTANNSHGGGYSHRFLSTGGFRIWAQDASVNVSAGSTVNDAVYLTTRISTDAGGETNTLFQDGVQTGTATGSPLFRDARATTNIGRSSQLGGNLDGLIFELIAYPSDQSANRQQIESNINTHYGIY